MRASKFVIVFLFQLGISTAGFTQAWIPPKGMAAISINYQYFQVDNHVFSTGIRLDRGQIFANTIIADFNYSFTDKFAASVNLPFINSKYSGTFPHRISNSDGTFTIPVDDGNYHSTF